MKIHFSDRSFSQLQRRQRYTMVINSKKGMYKSNPSIYVYSSVKRNKGCSCKYDLIIDDVMKNIFGTL